MKDREDRKVWSQTDREDTMGARTIVGIIFTGLAVVRIMILPTPPATIDVLLIAGISVWGGACLLPNVTTQVIHWALQFVPWRRRDDAGRHK